jgi:hypothetical protein
MPSNTASSSALLLEKYTIQMKRGYGIVVDLSSFPQIQRGDKVIGIPCKSIINFNIW